MGGVRGGFVCRFGELRGYSEELIGLIVSLSLPELPAVCYVLACAASTKTHVVDFCSISSFPSPL